MTERKLPLLPAIAIVAAAQVAIAGLVAVFGSDRPIPMHFAFNGEVDRWGGREEAALVIGLMALISLGAAGSLVWSSRNADEARRRGLGWGVWVTLATTCVITAMIAVTAGAGFDTANAPRLTLMAVCLLLAVIGGVLGKVPPNAMVGVRTPWSLNSRLAWEKSNRLTGRLFFWAGLTGLMTAPFAPVATGHAVGLVVILLIAAVGVFESWRVWRADPERRVV